MSNIKFFYVNEWDVNAITTSSQKASWPALNTQHRWKTKCYKSQGVTGEWVQINGTNIAATGFFVFYHNLTSGAVVRIQGSNDNFLSTVYDEELTKSTTTKTLAHFPATTQTCNAFRVYVDDPFNPDGYIALGRVWLGMYWEPEYGYNSDGGPPKWKSRSIKSESDGGQISVFERLGTWEIPVEFDALNNEEYDAFVTGVKESAFVCVKKPYGYYLDDYPTPENCTYYCSLAENDKEPFGGVYVSAKMLLRVEQ